MKKDTYHIRKYDGDDCYSWAVFRNLPKGAPRGVICWGDGYQPILSGLSRSSALFYKKQLEKKQ